MNFLERMSQGTFNRCWESNEHEMICIGYPQARGERYTQPHRPSTILPGTGAFYINFW